MNSLVKPTETNKENRQRSQPSHFEGGSNFNDPAARLAALLGPSQFLVSSRSSHFIKGERMEVALLNAVRSAFDRGDGLLLDGEE